MSTSILYIISIYMHIIFNNFILKPIIETIFFYFSISFHLLYDKRIILPLYSILFAFTQMSQMTPLF